jgi:hypothetical protein
LTNLAAPLRHTNLASAKTRFSMTLVDGVRLGLALVPPPQQQGSDSLASSR